MDNVLTYMVQEFGRNLLVWSSNAPQDFILPMSGRSKGVTHGWVAPYFFDFFDRSITKAYNYENEKNSA